MAKTRTQPAVEETETEETQVKRPADVAKELGVSAKALRAFLRREFPRPTDAKNTSWALTDAQVEAATKHFAEDEDDETEDEG